MRRLAAALLASALCAALLAPAAHAAFGLEKLELAFLDSGGDPSMQAGSHPYTFLNTLEVNLDEAGNPEGSPRDVEVDLPPGFAGLPTATQRCPNEDFISLYLTAPLSGQPMCPSSAALGYIAAKAPGESVFGDFGVAYNLDPPPGKVLKLGFRVLGTFITITAGVRQDPPYNPFATARNIQQVEPFVGSELTLWGNPAEEGHDAQRGDCFTTGAADECEAGGLPRAFLTLPPHCPGPLVVYFRARSWQQPATWVTGQSQTPPTFGCGALGFGPDIAAAPTTKSAESPSGLDFNLDVADKGLTEPKGLADSDIEKVVVTMPAGMTLNPSAAEGLATCSPADLARETLDSAPGQGCPQASKVGSLEIESPLLEGEVVKGQVFVATQDDPATPQPGAENPFDSLLAIYLVVKDPELGILVKQAGKVEPSEERGPDAGRLISSFDQIPQFPLSHVRFHFREGARSPLITPPHCGSYRIEAELTPWANPDHPIERSAPFEIDSGPGGGPCPPQGTPAFAPGFAAGSLDNGAGRYSPFVMRLTRKDAEQDMTRFSAVLPPGVTGRVAGLGRCAEDQIAAARAKTGRAELASPSCPEGSRIGRTLAGAGVGSQLTWVPGSLYLAGPVGGDPLSVVAITPAVAGPFDAGTVVVRVALTFNQQTNRFEIDGASSEPIPHVLKGIVLKLRDLRVYADRPDFTLNPTNCSPLATEATLFGSAADVFDPADDAPVALSSPFRAADCAALGFKPKLRFSLSGGTRRGAHPALKAVVTPRPGTDANFAGAVVTLPRSAFLEQAHIRTICTRVQFAAHACPPGSVYGHARAWSPLIDKPAEGPVYLRSSSHNLPDLVVALKGPPEAAVEATLVGRIDSHKGGIRTSFEDLPDLPVSRFVLNMQGGRKGLIVNSRGLCARRSRSTARLRAQSNRRRNARPAVRATRCKGKRQQRRHGAHRRSR